MLPQVEVVKDAMLGFLFRGLTAERPSATALFDALTAEARQKHWYVEGEVPDTLDGRFAVLATITALANVRLERDEDEGERLSVALAERFIEVMESEHRELGLGDPASDEPCASSSRCWPNGQGCGVKLRPESGT